MSILVNELRDFTIQTFKGEIVTINVEDLRFIMAQAYAAMDKTLIYKGLRFVYLRQSELLVLDESNKVTKSVGESYNISIATPPMTGYEFDLAFVAKNVTPVPAAIKLSEALQVVGYNGPRVTTLRQIYMYMIALNTISSGSVVVDLTTIDNTITTLATRTTALEKRIFAHIEWSSTQPVFGGVQTFPTNSEINMPWNRLVYSSSVSDVLVENKVIKLKEPGIYMLSGAWTHRADTNYRLCRTGIRINGVNQLTDISTGKTTELTPELAGSPVELPAASQVFNFITHITNGHVSANGDGYAWVTVTLICSFAGQLTGLSNYNFINVAKVA